MEKAGMRYVQKSSLKPFNAKDTQNYLFANPLIGWFFTEILLKGYNSDKKRDQGVRITKEFMTSHANYEPNVKYVFWKCCYPYASLECARGVEYTPVFTDLTKDKVTNQKHHVVDVCGFKYLPQDDLCFQLKIWVVQAHFAWKQPVLSKVITDQELNSRKVVFPQTLNNISMGYGSLSWEIRRFKINIQNRFLPTTWNWTPTNKLASRRKSVWLTYPGADKEAVKTKKQVVARNLTSAMSFVTAPREFDFR